MTVADFVNSLGPLPTSRAEHTLVLAKELARGAEEGLWGPTFHTMQSDTDGSDVMPADKNVAEYMRCRWGNPHIGKRLNMLEAGGYVVKSGYAQSKLTPQAFSLLD